MNKYKWQIINEIAFEKETNTSFNVNAESEYSTRFKQYLADGGEVDPTDTEKEQPVKEILRSVIIERLKAKGKFSEAFNVLKADEEAYFIWLSMVTIKVNDPQVTALLQSIGVNPDEILY